MTSHTEPVRITPYRDGPLIVRGDFELSSPEGTPIPRTRRTVALCRCGVSAIKPFCDGTHKIVGFRSGELDGEPQESVGAASDRAAPPVRSEDPPSVQD